MLQWQEVDLHAVYPFERYKAVSGNHEHRIFYGPEAASQDKPWILVIRLDLHEHVHHSIHTTEADAKRAAEAWEGKP
jgi:hypothetical protein